MKEYYKHILVVLVYRNTTDILDFIDSVNKNITESKIIIVNSYYDDESLELVRKIANSNNCDFINVENKGFSYGNNIGLKYALDNYDFDFVTCSNPDVVINKFEDKILTEYPDSIYGPEITTINGRKQNPMVIFKNDFINKLIYYSYTKNIRFFFILAVACSKVLRFVGRCSYAVKNMNSYPVFQLHGCFII
ncbi:TPA: glycosyltransferase, partial [Streptococcus suis]